MSINVLDIKLLSKAFGKNSVIKKLNLSIREGTVFGLIGSNGSGKTTTINCIANLLEIDSGKIRIFGKEMKSDSIIIKKEMGIMFENAENLFIHLTGEEQLQFVGEIYGIGNTELRQRIDELFNYFELNDHRTKLIEEYSKGMKKKIALASILLYNPDFIILDEPFDGLDTVSVIKVKKIINSLKKQDKTILITSHILSYIEDLADEIAIINNSKIVYQSATKDIRNKIKNEITQETYQSLEEIFIDLTTDKQEEKGLPSWL